MGTCCYRLHECRLLAIPSAEGTQTKRLTHPQHVVAIAAGLLVGIGIELRLLQLQLLVELTIEVQRLTGIKVDADAVELALEIDAMMVLDIVGVGAS